MLFSCFLQKNFSILWFPQRSVLFEPFQTCLYRKDVHYIPCPKVLWVPLQSFTGMCYVVVLLCNFPTENTACFRSLYSFSLLCLSVVLHVSRTILLPPPPPPVPTHPNCPGFVDVKSGEAETCTVHQNVCMLDPCLPLPWSPTEWVFLLSLLRGKEPCGC